MRTYTIIRTDTGQVAGTQTVPDDVAPVLLNGFSAIMTPVGFNVLTGTFTGAGAGAARALTSNFNIMLSGTFVATVALEKSFDGVAWAAATFSDGTPATYSGPMSTTWGEVQTGVQYRLNCTAFTSGTVSWRISQ